MIRSRGLLVAVLWAALSAGASSADGPAGCETLLARSPDGEEPAQCLYKAGAAGRLRELLALHPEDPWYPLNLAHLAWQTRRPEDLPEAERLYRRTIEVAGRRGNARAELLGRAGLIRMLQDAGDLDAAGAEIERSARTAAVSGDRQLQLKVEIARARLWQARGEVESAYSTLIRIREAVEAERSYPLAREYLFTLGNPLVQTGRFREAQNAYRRLAALAAANEDPRTEAAARNGLASSRRDELAEVPTAAGREELLRLARENLRLARRAGDPFVEVYSLWLLGSLEEPAEAVAHLERCFELATTPLFKSYCKSELAKRLAGLDPPAARGAIQEALALARQSGDILAQTSSWREQMRVSWALSPGEEAWKDGARALDAIEALRDQQGGSASQPGLFSTWAESYHWLSGRLLEQGRLERAFGVTERMRSRALMDSLGLADTRHASPPDFASLARVRATLAPEEALLSFQIAPWQDLDGGFGGGSWLLASTRGSIQLYRLPDRSRVRNATTALSGMFTARDGSEAEAAARLHRELLAPALADLPPGIRRLTIIPDDFLHRVPFAALRPQPDGEPLATRYEITLAPSATLWLHWREARPAPAATRALVLAEPATLVDLGPLPHALTEGKAVLKHLGGGELLAGRRATETFIKRNGAEPYGLVHFAAHAVKDEVNPDRAGIHLSPGDPAEDGLLQAREIVGLDLDERIVVVSTCESASGKILRGEGVMGLARAFFQAGAHTVVASLWPLRDDDGAALFDRFYRHLARGKSVAAALQAAQRDRMEKGAPAEAWAGVVVLGDGDRVPVPGGRSSPAPFAGAALVTLLLAAGLLLRRGAGRARRPRG